MAGAASRAGSGRLTSMSMRAAAAPAVRYGSRMIGGYRTETLEISADGPPALLCVVIPGNPGVAQFYETFVTRLHAALGGAAHVLAVSHLGMDRQQRWTPPGKLFHLEEQARAGWAGAVALPSALTRAAGAVCAAFRSPQIEHKVALLRELQGPGQPPVVIIAHSIGAFMSNHAVHRLESSEAEARESHLIARALDDVAEADEASGGAGQPSQQRLRQELEAALQHELKMAEGRAQGAAGPGQQREQQPAAPAAGRKQRQQETASGGSGAPSVRGGSRSNVALVVSLFPFYAADPSSLKQRQLRWLAQHHRSLRAAAGALALLPGGLKRAAVRLFSRDMDDGPSVEAAASLVHPDAELAAPADWWLLRALGRRAVVCSAPADTWFPAHHMEEMADEVPGLLHLHLPLTHAFCVSAAQCTRLATELASHIQRAVGREEGEQAAAGAQPSHSKL
eukprot:scaffold19.g1823.t1